MTREKMIADAIKHGLNIDHVQRESVMAEDTRRFRIQDLNGIDVFGEVGVDNVYISTYGNIQEGRKAPKDLELDESTLKTYALSGQKATTYNIVRVK